MHAMMLCASGKAKKHDNSKFKSTLLVVGHPELHSEIGEKAVAKLAHSTIACFRCIRAHLPSDPSGFTVTAVAADFFQIWPYRHLKACIDVSKNGRL